MTDGGIREYKKIRIPWGRRDPHADFVGEFTRETEYCTYCPMMCRFSCPVVENDGGESLAPGRKLTLIDLIRRGQAEASDDALRIFSQCTECLRCNTYCVHDIKPPVVLRRAKEDLLGEGHASAAVARARENYAKAGNFFGVDLVGSLRSAVPGEFFREGTRALYFPGCVQSRYYPATVRRALEVVSGAGLDIALAPGPVLCSGYPYLALGDAGTFRTIAGRNRTILDRYELILSPCPACVHTLTTAYREAGVRLRARVLHIVSWLHGLLKEGRIVPRASIRKRVGYHDPCFLGRHLGVYEAPREILRSLTPGAVLEAQTSGDDASCCGAGGALPHTNPALARTIARERAAEFAAAGAEAIVTACPSCRRWLEKSGGIEIMDIIDAL